jgi:hypothetical protein
MGRMECRSDWRHIPALMRLSDGADGTPERLATHSSVCLRTYKRFCSYTEMLLSGGLSIMPEEEQVTASVV